MVYNATRWLNFAQKMREKRTLLSDWRILTLEESMVVGLIHCYFTYTECRECGDDSMPPKRFWCGISQAEQVYIIFTNYMCFFETMVVGPSSNGLMILMRCGSNSRIGHRTSWILMDFDGFWPCHQFTPRWFKRFQNRVYRMVPPSYVCWFINPMKSIVISAINHSEMGVINQLS